jgi:hypothetical protein
MLDNVLETLFTRISRASPIPSWDTPKGTSQELSNRENLSRYKRIRFFWEREMELDIGNNKVFSV